MSNPTLKATVAWNNDGDHNAADADISAVVRELHYGHVMDRDTEHMPAAFCELKLLNTDGKYSPNNPASSLYRKLRAGRDLWVRLGYPTDDFTAANGDLDGRSLANDSNYTWNNDDGFMRIVSNKAGVTAVGDTHVSTTDLEIADAEIGAWYDRNDSDDAAHRGGLVVRFTSTTEFHYVRVYADKLELRTVSGGAMFSGSDTLSGTGNYTWPVGEEKFIHVIAHGRNIRVLVEDVEVLDITTIVHQTATKFGMWLHDASGTSTNTIDDWGAWRSLFFGQIKTPQDRPGRGTVYAWLSAHDAFERFAEDNISWLSNAQRGGLISFSRTSNQLAAQLLERVDWDIGQSATTPKGRTQMDAGETLTGSIGGIKSVNDPLLDLLYSIQDEEDGLVYMDGDGFFRLEDRTHKVDDDPHTADVAVLTDDSTTPPYYRASGFEIDPGISYVQNPISVSVQRDFSRFDDGYVWTMEEIDKGSVGISFSAFEVRRILARLTEVDWELDWRVPVATQDYTANLAADGSGTDITSDLVVTHIERNRYDYSTRMIEVRWGPRDGFLTKLKARGTRAFRSHEATEVIASSNVSLGRYGDRAVEIDAMFIDTASEGQAMADSRHRRRRQALMFMTAPLPLGSKVQNREAVHRKISDQLQVKRGTELDIQAYIVGVELDWTPDGPAVCRWTLREKPAPAVAETDAETGEPIAQELRIFTGESDDGVTLAAVGAGVAALNGNDSVVVASGATAGDDGHYSGDALLTPSKSPIVRYDVEHATTGGSPFVASMDYFVGLRETPATDVPSVAVGDAEDIAGFVWEGTAFAARVRRGGEITSETLAAVSADTVNIFEVKILEGREARFFIGGRLVSTILTNVPANDLQWDIVSNRNVNQTNIRGMVVTNVEVRQANHPFADALVDAPRPNQRRITRHYFTNLENVATRDVGGGNNVAALNGADQTALIVDTGGATAPSDHVAIEQKARVTNIGQDGFPASRNPWFLLDFEYVQAPSVRYSVDIGLRDVLSGVKVAAGEDYAIVRLLVTTVMTFRTGDGAAETATVVADISTGRHILEIRIRDGVSVEYLLDGAVVATHVANLPTSGTVLHWQKLVLNEIGSGDSTEGIVLHRMEIEADPS